MCDTAAVAAAVQAAATAAQLARGFSQPGMTQTKVPDAPPMPDDSMTLARQLPQTRADAAARVGGGMSPEFLAAMTAQDSGVPGGGTEILEQIRRSLGQGQA